MEIYHFHCTMGICPVQGMLVRLLKLSINSTYFKREGESSPPLVRLREIGYTIKTYEIIHMWEEHP